MLHLHNNYSFTESLVETVIRSLRHSSRSELTRQGTSLPQDRHSYGRRLWELRSRASGDCSPSPSSLTYRHRAGVSLYTSAYALAETCVFSKQSPDPFHCGPPRL